MHEKQARVLRWNREAYESGIGHLAESPSSAPSLQDCFADRPGPTDVLVELGCGTGTVLASLTNRCIGIELAQAPLRRASRRPDLLYVQGDAQRIPLLDASVDCVLMQAALHHFPNYLQGLEESRRILKTGGRLYLSEANRWGLLPVRVAFFPLNIVRRLLNRFPKHEVHAGKLSLPKIQQLLLDRGCRVHHLHAFRSCLGIINDLLRQHLSLDQRLPGLARFLHRLDRLFAASLPPWGRAYYYLTLVKVR